MTVLFRSPCLDDGYNSQANTGSTQSNLSGKCREIPDIPRLHRIKELVSRSERSIDSSPLMNTSSRNTNSNNSNNELHLSHLTCPLQRPDGASDTESSWETPSAQHSVSAHSQIESPRVALLKQTPSLSTNSDSYEFDDYLPPPILDESSRSWPLPPTSEELPPLT